MAAQLKGWLYVLGAFCALSVDLAWAGPLDTEGSLSVSESGAATYTVPVQVPPGIAGMEPKLSLSYNSQTGNGLLGVGWSLSGLSAITRCPQTKAQDNARVGISFGATDRFCLDGQRLILVTGTYGNADSEYRTERDTFSKIIAKGGSAGAGDPTWFEVKTKAGQTIQYGNTTDSRIEVQSGSAARVWALNRITDSKGNYLTYAYTEDTANGDYRPSQINYTLNGAVNSGQSVQFQYEDRINSSVSEPLPALYIQGKSVKTLKRLKTIQTFVGANAVKEYRLTYEASPTSGRSRIKTLQECAVAPTVVCKPALDFTWTSTAFSLSATSNPNPNSWNFGAPPGGFYASVQGDFNGDGKTDYVELKNTTLYTLLSDGNGQFTGVPKTLSWDFGSPPDGLTYQFISGDFNADGLTDFMAVAGANYYMFISTGNGNFDASQRTLPNSWNFGAVSGVYNYILGLGDFNADGRTDVFAYNTASGANGAYYVLISNGDGNFTGSSGSTGLTMSTIVGGIVGSANYAGQVQLSDYNGDGFTDLLIYNSSGKHQECVTFPFTICWDVGDPPFTMYSYKGNGDGTLASPITYVQNTGSGPQIGNTILTKSRQMDINGDGIADFVYRDRTFRNTSISQGSGWPTPQSTTGLATDMSAYQIGYGDFNGDGKTDYLGLSGTSFYAGMSKGDGEFNEFPGTTTISVPASSQQIDGDFNGDGRADIAFVTGSTTIVYFAGGNQPDVVTEVRNGLSTSAIATVTYGTLANSALYTKGSGASYPKQDIQPPLPVVSQTQSSNGLGGVGITSAYKYGSYKVDLEGRNLGLGWMSVETVSPNPSSAPFDILSTTTYSQTWPYVGLPLQILKTTPSSSETSNRISQVDNTLACMNPANGGSTCNGGYHFPYVQQSLESTWDLNGTQLPVVTTTNGSVDQYGNIGTIAVTASDGYGKSTTNTYSNDTTNWLLGRLVKTVVVATAPDITAPGAAPTSLSIVPLSADKLEGNSGTTTFTFTVNRSGTTTGSSSATWTVTGSGTNPATTADFTGGTFPTGTVSFTAGQTTQSITVNVAGDTTGEPDEGFTVTLSNPSNASLGTATANGVIRNDDSVTTLSIAPLDADKPEGNSGTTPFTFTVTRTGPTTATSSVNWTVTGTALLSGSGTVADASDISGGFPTNQVLNFAVGETIKTITVNAAGDTTDENDNGFTVTLSSPQGATLGTSTATGAIRNDDGTRPTVTIAAGAADTTEGTGLGYKSFDFILTLNTAGSKTVYVPWSVAGSGANPTDGTDYQSSSGTATITTGNTSNSFNVRVRRDSESEPDEQFTVSLGTPVNANLSTPSTAIGTVRDDDTPATLAIAATSADKSEGNSGSTAYTFTVTRSGSTTATASVNWAVSGNGSPAATAADFAGGTFPSGSVSFAVGETAKAITVNVQGETTAESDEGFKVTLSGATGATITTATANGVIRDDDTVLSLTAVSPNVGPTTGNASVVLTGTGFATGASVTIGGNPATGCTLQSSTSIACTTPAGSLGTVSVVVTQSTNSVTLTNAYTYKAAPTLIAISPNSGSISGGQEIWFFGENLDSSTTASFGGTPATGCHIYLDTTWGISFFICNTPASATTGAKDVVVNNGGGTATLTGGYTYTSSGPTLSGISPSSGRLGGNDFITLTGTGFVSGAVVTIGGNVATSCTVQSTTSITCYSPAGTLGAKDVVLSQSTGTQSLAGAFTYVPGPTLTGVSPTSGPTSGGTSVTMTGTNFLSGTIVRFGGFDATGCSLSGTTSISCATPSLLNPGAVNVDIVTNGGVATLTNAYTYTAAAPTLTSVSPTSGAAAGGELIILNGTNFINGATVTVGGVAQYGCAMGAPAGAQMYCTTAPNTPGVKTVVVTTSSGSATLTNAYTVIGASCPSGTTVNWSQSQSAWYGNTNTQGTYACSGTLPATIADGGSTSVSNTTSGRSGSVTASCSNGTVSLSGQSCDGGTLAAGEDCNWSPWGTYGIDVNYAYITYLKRCPVTSDYSYWTGIAETYGQATMTNAIATSPEASCAASAGHICPAAESNYCGATAGYPWNSPGQNLCKRLP